MNKPMLEDKDKVAKVYNSKGEVCETFSFRDHGNSYLSAAQNYLMQNYDKLMAEETEQMDEGNKENKKKKNEYVSNIIKKKLSPEVLPSLKYGRRELKKEEVEQMDEAKGEYGPDSSLHGHPLRDIDAHLKDNGYIHSKKSDTTHHYTRKDGRMVVHVDPKTKKVVKAFLEPIKKLKEEVEQIDEAKWRDPELKGKTFMNPRPVNRAPKDRSEYYGGDMNNPGELRGDEKIPLDREGKPELRTDPLADRANLPTRTKGGQKFPRVGPLMQAIMNKEEVEQMDEAHKINDPVKIVRGPRKGIEGYIGEIRHGLYKGAPKRYTVFHGKDGATQVGKEDIRKIKEKVEQMDESSGDAPIDKMSHKDLANYIGEHPEWVEKNREEAEKLAHEKTEDLQEKLTSDMSLADVIRDFVHSDNKRFKGKSKEERIDMAKGAYYGMHENKIYTNVIAKLEEGRKPKPPAEGKKPSAAWLRQQEREKASGGKEPEKKKEPEHVVAQILKHQDYGYKDHEYTFHDGSKLNVTPEKRDKIIRKIQSLTGPGPGKSPEARKKLYDELNTRKGFLHHTGDEPIPVVKLHPMSAQKK